ncbi:hypothetical protein Aperf_G00000006972 [Anoplocephala perfoliata]
MNEESVEVEVISSQPNQRSLSSDVVAFNVHNLICSISIIGVPYAFAIGGRTAIASAFFVGAPSWYTYELTGQCLFNHLPSGKEKFVVTVYSNLSCPVS